MTLALLLAAASWVLTPDGWGPVRIGMTEAQVERALRVRLHGEPLESRDENACVEMDSARFPDVVFMFEDKKLSRISLWEKSTITTSRGIGLGSSADQVRRAYGRALIASPHIYESAPAEYLTYWVVKGKRGVRFETDGERRVQAIHAGASAIEYVEGCA